MSDIDVQLKGLQANFYPRGLGGFPPTEEDNQEYKDKWEKAWEETNKDKDKVVENMRLALELLRECEDLAKKYNQSFHWPGPSYGMGGWFHPEDVRKEDNNPNRDTYFEWYGTDEFGGWQSSNTGC